MCISCHVSRTCGQNHLNKNISNQLAKFPVRYLRRQTVLTRECVQINTQPRITPIVCLTDTGCYTRTANLSCMRANSLIVCFGYSRDFPTRERIIVQKDQRFRRLARAFVKECKHFTQITVESFETINENIIMF